MSGNLHDALIDTMGLIDDHFPYPMHQGTTDVTEVLEMARLASEHNLTDRQCDIFIDMTQEYLDAKITSYYQQCKS